jgi:hypothetical protein
MKPAGGETTRIPIFDPGKYFQTYDIQEEYSKMKTSLRVITILVILQDRVFERKGRPDLLVLG